MANSLVASATDTTSAFSGAFIIEDGISLSNAISSGDWVSGGVAAFSEALDVAVAVIDPIGTLIANGLGFMIDHFDPLKTWFDQLTGNADEVAAFGRTWDNVAARMRQVGGDVKTRLADLDGLSGETIDTYRSYATDLGKHLTAAGDWAESVSKGLALASQLVKMVHDLVRDALSQVVGMAISAAIELLVTVGTTAPGVIAQIATRVTSLATRIGEVITRLLESFKALKPILEAFEKFGSRVVEFLSKLLKGGGKSAAEDAGEITMRPLTAAEKVKYRRPSGYRKDVKNTTFNNAKDASGQVRDPLTDTVIKHNDDWEMGHKPGYEFRKHQVSAADRGISRQQFLDEHNNPDHYRPELPSSNHGHQAEDHSNSWLGP